ncbi:MAG: CHC2 zinc finger domain-containing protein [Candidatus Omnitrophota bacterium]|nr:CHC2 zinc finger domain-containing protein [Candidatus Omnitrophota bacterium]
MNRIKNINDSELVSIFPEAKRFIPQKLKEWRARLKEIEDVIEFNLILIRASTKDEFSRWFMIELVKMDVEPALLEATRQIQRLKHLKAVSEGKSPNVDFREAVERAKAVPILEVAESLKLKRSGENFKGICPFHPDKDPSFYVYPETNSFYCFGCHKAGDVIALAEHLFGLSFKDAVCRLGDFNG